MALVRNAIVGVIAPFVSTGGLASDVQLTDVTSTSGLISTHQPADAFVFAPVDLRQMLGGGAVGDFDRDGYPDIVLVTGGAAPDKLFMNQGDGTFVDEAASWGLEEPHLGMAAAVADYDGDGWLDVFICSLGPSDGAPSAGAHKLYRNAGDRSFTDVASTAGVAGDFVDGLGAAWGDYDLDGDLDLAVACWTGFGSRVFRNDGDGTFTDVTQQIGVYDTAVRGFSPAFVDMNGDRHPELLLAADYGTSRYYLNNTDGTFTDVTAGAGAGLDGNGMGHAIGDFNGDGLLDWYVTSIHTQVPIPPAIPGTGNMLYLADGAGGFVERSVEFGVSDGGWGWGTVAVDIDHDGDEDLVETNGWQGLNGSGEHEWVDERSYLFLNEDGAGFVEAGESAGLTHDAQGRGLITLDYDRDGDQDLVFIANSDAVAIYRNDLGRAPANWLRLSLDTRANPRLAPDGFGTLVRVTAGGRTFVRCLVGACTFMSQSELAVHFGLGMTELIDELRVEWNDGTVTRLTAVAVNQTLTIDSGYASDLDGDADVDVDDLLHLVEHWGRAGAADLNADDRVDETDLSILLGNWTDDATR